MIGNQLLVLIYYNPRVTPNILTADDLDLLPQPRYSRQQVQPRFAHTKLRLVHFIGCALQR